MKKITKDRGSIICNDSTWETLKKEITTINPTTIFVLVDVNTKHFCLPYFLEKIKLSSSVEILTIEAGEEFKTIETCLSVWQTLSEKGADRKSLLINLGGGVITDLGGFVASTFKRGIEFINIPTSLLAMVDASVGGKNGVDLGVLKNQIGVIRDAKCVIIDTHFLKTLPTKQITSGFAEMLKHGIIHSDKYWNNVKHFNIEKIDKAVALIWQSIEIKNEVVTKDPLENNLRKTLNYGHTLGHAIESYCLENDSKQTLLHGEAIAVGMILATYISSELLSFPKDKLKDITDTLLSNFPKVSFDEKDIEEIIKLLIYDKKNRSGKVYFVLLYDIGKYKSDCEVPNALINNAFNYYKKY
jgi:3-dehydroquinate synthase